MLAQVVDTWRAAGFAEIVVVLGYGAQALRKTIQERFLRVEESRAFAGARETDTAGGDLRPAAPPPPAGAPPPPRATEPDEPVTADGHAEDDPGPVDPEAAR
jgi:hypothetical protein